MVERLILVLFICITPSVSFQHLKVRSNVNYDRHCWFAGSENNDLIGNADFVDLEVYPHRPLGCSVEESLDGSSCVFITDIKSGSNAEKGGLREGDVLVGVSGLFDELDDVTQVGLEKVKGLVSARPESETLYIRVARGSKVMEKHNEILVELCGNADNDKEVEECIVDFLKAGYQDDTISRPEDQVDGNDCEKDDADCLIDGIYSLWAEEFEEDASSPGLNEDLVSPSVGSPEAESNKPKPWSSRASPSGTFVRDPVTGEMRNIDA